MIGYHGSQSDLSPLLKEDHLPLGVGEFASDADNWKLFRQDGCVQLISITI